MRKKVVHLYRRRHGIEEWVVDKYVGNWDQRRDVENDEKYDRMCEKGCDVGRGNIQTC